MICRKCGARISDESSFCERCGSEIFGVQYLYDKSLNSIQKVIVKQSEAKKEYRLEREDYYCVYCGTKLPKAAAFCFKCGQPVFKESR